MNLPQRAYLALLKLLPSRLHADFGSEIARTAADLAKRPRYRSLPGRAALVFGLLADVLVASIWQRADRGRRARRPRRGPIHLALESGRRRETPPGSPHQLPPAPPLPGRRATMENLLRDIRHGLRGLCRTPGFSLASISILALGIGANAAIFSVVNDVLLRPLPYRDAERLVVLAQTYNGDPINSTYLDVVDWQRQARLFEGITGFDDRKVFNLTGGDAPEQVYGASVTGNFFEVLGVEPILGRTIEARDDAPDSDRVVVVSEGLWRRRLGADPNAIGNGLSMNGDVYAIVGVMPASFQVPEREQLWVPLATHAYEDDRMTSRNNHFLEAIGRLASGITLQQGREEIEAIAAAIADAHPGEAAGKGATAWSLREQILGAIEPSLRLLWASVGLVLLAACANVASLTLARATTRHRELAVQLALGADRIRLTRQHLVEAGLMAATGAASGLLLARWMLPFLLSLDPGALPRDATGGLNVNILAFVGALVVAATLIAGAAPVLFISSRDLAANLKEGTVVAGGAASRRRRRLRTGLVVAEVALAVVLLAGAALLTRSFARIIAIEPGFATEDLLTARLSLPLTSYGAPERQIEFFELLRQRLAAVPGVERVGLASRLPLTEGTSTTTFYIEGMGEVPANELPAAHVRFVMPGFFEALQIPLLRGRTFAAQDGRGEAVVIVDEELASRLWADEDALGKRMAQDPEGTWFRVVGVVGATHHWGQRYGPTPTLYVPFSMMPAPSMMVALRTHGAPTALAPALRDVVASLDRDLPISDIQTMEARLSGTLSQPRFNLGLLASFAVLALLLGGLGLYGVTAHSVAQRSHEIGVRMALGARRADVRRMVVRQGLTLAAAGILVGLPAYAAASRLIGSMLFEIEATDPSTLVSVSILVVAVSLLATYIPARRATRVDPLVGLRAE